MLSVNINISAKFHKDGKGEKHEIRIHSATECCSIKLKTTDVSEESDVTPFKVEKYNYS
jgi:hypothetical protein